MIIDFVKKKCNMGEQSIWNKLNMKCIAIFLKLLSTVYFSFFFNYVYQKLDYHHYLF